MKILKLFRVGLPLIWVLCPFALGQESAQDSPEVAETLAAPGDTATAMSCAQVEARLADSSRKLEERRPILQSRLAEIEKALDALEAESERLSLAELTLRRQTYRTERTALQDELKFITDVASAWQAALDDCKRRMEFVDRLQRETGGEVPAPAEGEREALRQQLQQVRSSAANLETEQEGRAKRLEALKDIPTDAEAFVRFAMEAELSDLRARAQRALQQGARLDAEAAWIQARLAREPAVAPATAPATAPVPPPPPATATAPAGETDRAEVETIQRRAEATEREARDQLGYYRRRLAEIEQRVTANRDAGRPMLYLELERAYFQRLVDYERRRLEQAELEQRAARELNAVAQLDETLRGVLAEVELLRERRDELTREQRHTQADAFHESANNAQQRSAEFLRRTEVESEAVKVVRQLLPQLDAVEAAMIERLRQAEGDDATIISNHLPSFRRQLDVERQQIELHVATLRNIVFALTRQATLNEKLASAYRQAAEILVPPQPPFFERHRKVINAFGILLGILIATQVTKLLVWGTREGIQFANGRYLHKQISTKRISTLLGFASSILRLFIWVFGLIWILEVFGISPAATSGALGLIGLILAGMFQQIVIDFVKGIDIIAGRHYNVGDFVEVDGKMGHVIDLNVKHTRIRTMSGQEFNIPNSRCVPSRCFPDGYVNNYVDITLAEAGQVASAKIRIAEICAALNQRLEPIRKEPDLVRRFDGPGDRVTLRYRVSLLPGAEWVLNDYLIPEVKKSLATAEIPLVGEPTYFFINRIDTFRKLFSRTLSEEEIVREVKHVAPDLPDTPKGA